MNRVERLESVKAGLWGSLAAGLFFGVAALVNIWLLIPRFDQLAGLQLEPDSPNGLIGVANALLSGFLFGVTYRYIIRQDANSHLKSGAVTAFGLVRGLAQIEMGLNTSSTLLPSVVLGAESILLFVVARIVLDWALYQHWVKPFGLLSNVDKPLG